MGEQVFTGLSEIEAVYRCVNCLQLKRAFTVKPVGEGRFNVTVTVERRPERLG